MVYRVVFVSGLLCVAACASAPPSPDATEDTNEVVEAPETAGALTYLTVEEFEEKVRAEEDFTAVFTAPGCGASRSYKAMLDEAKPEWQAVMPEALYALDIKKGFTPDYVASFMPYHPGFPSLVHFRKGVPVDLDAGWRTPEALQTFMNRNTDGSITARTSTAHMSDAEVRRMVVFGAIPGQLDLSGRDLSGLQLRYHKFTGANLAGARFDGGDLYNVSFSHTDLTGASFEDVSLHGVFWGDCVCPDGTRSAESGYTCEVRSVERERPYSALRRAPPTEDQARIVEGARHWSHAFLLELIREQLETRYGMAVTAPEPIDLEEGRARFVAVQGKASKEDLDPKLAEVWETLREVYVMELQHDEFEMTFYLGLRESAFVDDTWRSPQGLFMWQSERHVFEAAPESP